MKEDALRNSQTNNIIEIFNFYKDKDFYKIKLDFLRKIINKPFSIFIEKHLLYIELVLIVQKNNLLIMNNAFIQFLADLFARLFSEKPKFCAALQWVAFIVGGISSGIMYLESLCTLPTWISSLGSVNVLVGSVVALILSQLPQKGE